MVTEAMLVIRTGRRAATRRSTMGDGCRRTHSAHPGSDTAVSASKPRVSGELQPQSAPLDTASSSEMRAIASPTAPMTSSVPSGLAAGSVRRRTIIITMIATPRAPDPQNIHCHEPYCARAAAAGSPSAPPTPSDELIRLIAGASRRAGRISRIVAMPMGITPIPTPCRARPMSIGHSEVASAHSTEPTTMTAVQPMSTYFFG